MSSQLKLMFGLLSVVLVGCGELKASRLPFNSFGSQSDLEAPSIMTSPNDVTVFVGSPASFSVTATGSDPLTYQWVKDGDDISGATSATLMIGSAQDASAGVYTVRVSNPAGIAYSANARLTVSQLPVAPSITSQPSSITVTAGLAANFSVTAQGTGPLSYQWMKGAVTIAGATASSYSIATTIAGDAGNYSVKVTNSEGFVTSNNATLTVNPAPVAPTITGQPGSVTVTAGANVILNVTAEGTNPLNFQWRKNGNNIAGATLASLTISSAQVGDSGTYSVRVANNVGNVTSNNAVVTVNAAPVAPTITTQPSAVTVNAGAQASFSVVASGTGPLSYQWMKGAATIAGANSSTFTIASAQGSDAASYSVRVSNDVGFVNSNSALLTVNVPPQPPTISSQPASITVVSGGSASFSVVAQGSGTLSYQWFKGDVTIVGATAANFSISSSLASHAGDYKVRVSNNAGQVLSATATLTVLLAEEAVADWVTTTAFDKPVGALSTKAVSESSFGVEVIANPATVPMQISAFATVTPVTGRSCYKVGDPECVIFEITNSSTKNVDKICASGNIYIGSQPPFNDECNVGWYAPQGQNVYIGSLPPGVTNYVVFHNFKPSTVPGGVCYVEYLPKEAECFTNDPRAILRMKVKGTKK